MDSDVTGALGAASIFVTLFLLVLALLWFFLPFAIFGMKDKLTSIINENKRTNSELAKIATELASLRTELTARSERVRNS